MELRQLRAVDAVAAHRHFGRAAGALGVSQPALSQAVRALEDELGVQLFDRTTRRVVPTEAGEEFLERIGAALALLTGAESRARAAGRGLAGRLMIGVVGSAALPPVPTVLREYRRRYPEVELEIAELPTTEQTDRLRAGTLDVGVVRPPLTPTAGAGLDLTTIARHRLYAVLPRGHRLAARTRVAPRLLADEPFVRTPRDAGPGFHDTITAVCREAGFVPRVVQEAVQLWSITALVGAGFGVSILPESEVVRPPREVAFVPLTTRVVIPVALAVPRAAPSPQAVSFVRLARGLADVSGRRRSG